MVAMYNLVFVYFMDPKWFKPTAQSRVASLLPILWTYRDDALFPSFDV